MRAVRGMGVVALVAAIVLGGGALAQDRAETAASVVAQTNAYRAELGADSLRENEALATAAQDYADWLAERGGLESWGHRTDGRDPGERAREAGYAGCVGENLSYGKATGSLTRIGSLADVSMKGWKKSPHHDANLRRAKWRDIGVGLATGSEGGWTHFIVVQMFGDGSGSTNCRTIQ